jgi:hypothetical protein
VCYVLVAALVSSVAPMRYCRPAAAQLMPNYSVGVVDFVNESGVQGDLLARLATDAVVVEMSKTPRYDVGTTRTAMRKEMEELDLRPPLDNVGLAKLGERLNVDAMLQGSIKSVQLAGEGPTRRASVTLVVQMKDQASGEVINGAVQTGMSSSRPGYTADDDSLITEAINNAAFLCVKTMVDYIIPEATVLMNVGDGEVMLNKGSRDGMRPGMQMIVLRQREIIGYLEVRSVTPQDSRARVTKSMRGIQSEDRARAIFQMPTVSSTLKSAPLPSGAPRKSGGTNNPLSKIGKFLVGAAVVYGIFSLFKGGRGNEDAPNIGPSLTDPTVITWDPTLYGHGANVREYQILRDDFTTGAAPVMVVSDPSQIDAGRASVYSLYGNTTGTVVTYTQLASNPATSYTQATNNVPAEPFGTTHTYQVRVVLQQVAGSSSTDGTTAVTRYSYSRVSSSLTATAIDPVRNSDIISPAYDPNVAPPEILISDLQEGLVNFTWSTKAGADVYYIKVEPVIPGTAPSWQSSVVYATSVNVSLPDAARKELANLLSNSAYAEKTMKWRVYCRHQADSSPAWLAGQDNLFVIGGTPPAFP